MTTTPFLALPRELRILIFEYAISERIAAENPTLPQCRIKRLTTGNERWEWDVRYDSNAPVATYLSLMLCNSQLAAETKDFLERRRDHERQPASMALLMAYPSLYPRWEHIPGPPEFIRTLDIIVKVDHMYHPAFMTNGPHNATLKTIFEMLKRYIHRGPHLARPSPLSQPLQLNTLQITMAPPEPFEDMTYVYGFPAQQLETLFTEFKGLMRRLGRSGILSGSLGAFELRLEGKEWHRIPMTFNIWDEEDYTFFQSGSYKWDAGE